jgi:uncharacterized membrane protein
MEEFLQTWALRAALLLDIAATLVIVAAALQAIVRGAFVFGKPHVATNLQPVRRRFSEWLVLSLELLIGSDIVRTAVSPSWTELGQLAAIVLLRVVLTYTLAKDFREE